MLYQCSCSRQENHSFITGGVLRPTKTSTAYKPSIMAWQMQYGHEPLGLSLPPQKKEKKRTDFH